MKTKRRKRRNISLILMIIISLTIKTRGQELIDNYPGIPIISYSWELQWYSGSSYQHKKDAGITAITATMVNDTIFGYARTAGIKLLPYPGDSINAGYMVSKYTDAAYTIWEAEGNGNPENEATLERNDTLAAVYNDNGTYCIKTNYDSLSLSEEGVILWGPGYTQQDKYIFQDDTSATANIRQYTATFRIKLKEVIPSGRPGNLDSVVCKVRVYAKNDVGDTVTLGDNYITVRDLELNSWSLKSVQYSLNNLSPSYYTNYATGTESIQHLLGRKPYARYINGRLFRSSTDEVKYAERIFFEVTWRKINNYQILVDNILVYDQRGFNIKEYPEEQQDLIDEINNTNNYGRNYNRLNVSGADYDSTVVGWMAIDEPPTIDNYEPVRYIDSIMNAESNGKRGLFLSVSGSWDGTYGGNGNGPENAVIFEEMEKRMPLRFNTLNYYPFKSDTLSLTYLKGEVNSNMIENNLISMRGKNPNYMFTVQVGRWMDENNQGLTTKLTKEQFLYLTNIGLLCGAKGICFDNYFNLRDTNGNIKADGLYDYESGIPENHYYTLRDTISPRMQGLFGKAIKNLNQESSQIDLDLRISNYTDEYIDSVKTNGVGNDTVEVDIGIFSDSSNSDKKYLMLLSRWYNTNSADRYTFQFKTYRNWVIYDYIDSISRGSSINTNNKGYFEDTISTGDARLYRIYPVVKYGGELNYDETVTLETLTENDLTINSGNTLTVVGTYDCYKNIVVNTGGRLDLRAGSTLNFYNGSKIVVNGLFTANGKSDTLINVDFQSVSGNPLNGIFFGNNSSGNIEYCL